MPAAALILWLSAGAAPPVEIGSVLAPDLYPAAVLLAAAEAADGRPNLVSTPEIHRIPIQIYVPLAITSETASSIRIALLLAGIHRLESLDGGGVPFAHVTTDPARPPRAERRFDVAVLTVRFIDAQAAAAALGQLAQRREERLAAGEFPTEFVADASGHRLVVRYSSKERFEEYRAHLATLDRAPESESKGVLRTWLPRFKTAKELEAALARRWDAKADGEIVALAAGSRSALLFRGTEAQWVKAQALLTEIDAP